METKITITWKQMLAFLVFSPLLCYVLLGSKSLFEWYVIMVSYVLMLISLLSLFFLWLTICVIVGAIIIYGCQKLFGCFKDYDISFTGGTLTILQKTE